MKLLDLLSGRRVDPTAAWPVRDYDVPAVDLSRMPFGALRFGASLQEALYFGRPESFSWSRKDYCELLYARGGFQLDFERGNLSYVAFFVGQDACLPDHPALSFTKPRIKGGGQLTQETRKDDLQKLFGSIESEDVDSEETILTFLRSGVTLEFELNAEGYLKRWNLFPKR